MEYISMSQLVTEIRRRTRDMADRRYPLLDKHEALRSAIRQMHGKYAVEAVYTSLSFATDNYDYPIPYYVDRVTRVERKSTVIGLTGDSILAADWQTIVWWDVRPTAQTNFLYIDKSYPVSDLRIWYMEDITDIPPSQSTLSQGISPTQGSIPVNASVMSMGVHDYPPRGYAQLREGNKMEVFYYGAITNTSFVDVTRGVYGVAASFSSTTMVDPVIVMNPGGAGYEWLLTESQAQLYQWRVNKASIRDRDTLTFLTRWNRQRADELNKALMDSRPPIPIKIGKRGRF